MVSQREPRRRSRLSLKAILLAALSLIGCSRRAEIEDAPDAGTVPTMEVPRPDGGVPLVEDAPLENAEGLRCADRPVQSVCRGANDFGCDFDGWIQQLAELCQTQTDCHTDGWVEVQLGAEGCATELRMEDPDAEYVACISEQLSQYRCPCADVAGSRFLGLAHDGCEEVACSTGELRCPPGSTCQEGKCVTE
jgi:hypothetical protein